MRIGEIKYLRPATALALTAIFALTALSCQTIVPVRTLPSWVRGIYIPMIENRSTEPGLSEIATRLIQYEFLADGRLAVVPKSDADLELICAIEKFWITIEADDNDDIPQLELIHIVLDLKLYDPLNPDSPLADLGKVQTTSLFNADPRSIDYVVEPDAKRSALGLLASQVVFRTISGFPVSLGDVPSSVELPTNVEPDASSRGDVLLRSRGALD